MALSLDRLTAGLARLERFLDVEQYDEHKEGQSARVAPPALTIALSREAGSGGAEIARAVGDLLGWPVYDNELLRHIAEQKGLSARLLETLDERYVSWLEEVARSFSAASGREGAYLRGLVELLASLSKAGHCVIVGRGAAQVLPPESTLSVRIIAPRAARIAAVQRRDGVSAAAAERWVDEHDRERQLFVKKYFGADVNAPGQYDLILNTRRISPAECAALIAQVARKLEAQQEKQTPAAANS